MPTSVTARRARLIAAVAAALTLGTQSLIGAPVASAVPASATQLPRGAWWYTELDLPKVWTINQGAGVTVAVIDTGVQASLGDLRGQVLPGPDARAHTDVPISGTGTFGHGSDMAALIAGTGKGAGIVGVAPKAKILPVAVRTSDTVSKSGGSLDTGLIAAGIRWAVAHGAKVINLSLGSVAACVDPERSAIAYAYQHDVIVVAATGDSPTAVSAPANCPGAIAVGAIDSAFKPWTNESYGPELAFVAPGFNLVNEELDGTLRGPDPAASGTSAATALVSGTFALLRSKFPHDSARQIVTRALYNVHNGLGAGHKDQRIDDHLGYGEILPYYALTTTPPANAANPIYDRFAQEIPADAPSSGSSATPSSSGTSSPAASSSPVAAHADSGGSSTGLIVGIVVAVVVVLIIAAVVLTRRRSRTTSSTGPPTWGG